MTNDTVTDMANVSSVIEKLSRFWLEQGCTIIEPFPHFMGAATFHPQCVFRSLKKEDVAVAYCQPCCRPDDSRGGNSDDRLSNFHQFQVLIRPIPDRVLQLYSESLKFIGMNFSQADSVFLADDWRSVSLSAYGFGSEHRVNGTEICQITYFASMGGCKVDPIIELAYGVERIACALSQGDIMSLPWSNNMSYSDLYREYEEQKTIPLAHADKLRSLIDNHIDMALCTIDRPLYSYDHYLEASHIFNMLDATGTLSNTTRQQLMIKLISLIKKICQIYS